MCFLSQSLSEQSSSTHFSLKTGTCSSNSKALKTRNPLSIISSQQYFKDSAKNHMTIQNKSLKKTQHSFSFFQLCSNSFYTLLSLSSKNSKLFFVTFHSLEESMLQILAQLIQAVLSTKYQLPSSTLSTILRPQEKNMSITVKLWI